MSLGIDQLVIVLKTLADIAFAIPECGQVSISPIVFNSAADFWNNFDPKNTQVSIETTDVALTTIRQIKPVERPETHGGVFTYTFSYNVFKRSQFQRVDETQSDNYEKRVLQSIKDFYSAVEQLSNALSEEIEITELLNGVAVGTIQLAIAEDNFRENEEGDFARFTEGFTAELPVLVKIRFKDC